MEGEALHSPNVPMRAATHAKPLPAQRFRPPVPEDAIPTALPQLLERKLVERFRHVNDAFVRTDSDYSGFLSRTEFRDMREPTKRTGLVATTCPPLIHPLQYRQSCLSACPARSWRLFPASAFVPGVVCSW